MSDNLKMPGVYRGSQKLATQQDLATLRQEIKRLIAGPIVDDVSENGYIPWKFNDDGTLDIEYLFPELIQKFDEDTGITITKDGVKLTSEVKTINFTGNYVYFDIDENGNVTVDIRAPKQEVSKFNYLDGITDSLVRIKNNVITGMIIPDSSAIDANPIYGDWAAGEVHEGFNWNENEYYDALTLYTEEPVWAADNESFFEVFIYNGYNEVIAQFKTRNITGNTGDEGLAAVSTGYNYNIKVKISNCKEVANGGISFKPTFNLNMIGLFGRSGARFHVKIVHHNGVYVNEYISKDYLFNTGVVPLMINPFFDVVSNALAAKDRLVSNWCSGLKYISQGEVIFNIQEVRYLNNLAATENKITFHFDNIDEELTKQTASLKNYDYNLNNVSSWGVTLYPSKEIFVNQPTSGYVIAHNAFGDSKTMNVTVNMLVNSITTLKQSDELNEYFNTEDFRVSNKFTSTISNGVKTLERWDSGKSLREQDGGTGLMVIPTSGLMYPFGDWSNCIPAGSPKYDDPSFLVSEKYFSRVFTGNSDLKFGGIFEFEGLTKEEFLDNRLSCIISPDQGLSWYSLKDVRNTKNMITKEDGTQIETTGILTNIVNTKNGVAVAWSYPGTSCSKNPIYFQIGLLPSSQFIIKSISLKGLDGTKEW